MSTIKQQLERAGFQMMNGSFGTTPAEPYPVGKNHFTPRWRDVYIGRCHWSGGGFGYYITSHIYGTMRRYRCCLSYDAHIANIFASGKTRREAVRSFLRNFESKTYNLDALSEFSKRA